jgi:hypothetical protein
MAVFHVARRYLRKRNHSFYTTVFEEILRRIYVSDVGEWVWSGMKTTAQEMWLPNDNLQGEKQRAGRYLLEGLAKLHKDQGLEIDLIGHSAGSIAIIEMLDAIERDFPDFRAHNVVFLAPACTLRRFVDGIVRKPQRFKRFRMYTMKDELETRDPLVAGIKPLYPSSLLYFISGVLEDSSDTPLAGMHRFIRTQDPFTDLDPYGEAAKFLKDGDRIVLSKTDANAGHGLRCDSEHHGGFASPQMIKDSLKYLIAN